MLASSMAVNGSSFLLGLRIRGPLLELPNFDSYGQQVSDEELDYLLASSRAESLAWAATIGEILFWGSANRRLQNTRYLHPLWFFALVICCRHGYRSRRQDAVRLFGFLGGRCRIFTGILGA
jgi:hypothetical protein